MIQGTITYFKGFCAFICEGKNRDSGATLVEYSILIGVLALICVSGLTIMGESMVPTFTRLANALLNP